MLWLNMQGLKKALLKLQKGLSPLTRDRWAQDEFLLTLADPLDVDKMSLLEDFAIRYLNVDVNSWFYAVYLFCQTVLLYTTIDMDNIRPIGVKMPLLLIEVKSNVHNYIYYQYHCTTAVRKMTPLVCASNIISSL